MNARGLSRQVPPNKAMQLTALRAAKAEQLAQEMYAKLRGITCTKFIT